MKFGNYFDPSDPQLQRVLDAFSNSVYPESDHRHYGNDPQKHIEENFDVFEIRSIHLDPLFVARGCCYAEPQNPQRAFIEAIEALNDDDPIFNGKMMSVEAKWDLGHICIVRLYSELYGDHIDATFCWGYATLDFSGGL